MPERTQQPIDQNRDRIDVSAEHECLFWTQKLGVSYATLKAAVLKAGSLASDVRRVLGK